MTLFLIDSNASSKYHVIPPVSLLGSTPSNFR